MKSGFEPKVYKELLGLAKATDIEQIEYEPEKLAYIIERDYVPDFRIRLSSGHILYIEAKGYFRPDDRTKLLAVREAHPEKDIRLLFQSNSKIHRLSKMRYADWAEKHDFIYAVGSLPREWFIDPQSGSISSERNFVE